MRWLTALFAFVLVTALLTVPLSHRAAAASNVLLKGVSKPEEPSGIPA